MTSMTGYAYSEISTERAEISVEIRSLNSRFLDLTVSLPPYLGRLEQRVRAAAAGKILRGKTDIFIRVREKRSAATVTADVDAAREYEAAIGKIAGALGRDAREIPLSLIVGQSGVLRSDTEYDAEAYWDDIQGVLSEALEQLSRDRAREGENLRRDILSNLDRLDECASFFRDWQPEMERRFREQIVGKFRELCGDAVDGQRVMTETAAMLVKYTINEEIVRLHSHLAALRAEIRDNPAPGKKMDFICQEINREINTIGSKNQFTEVGEKVVTAKDALESIREQARNIE